jgi:hypothetical protein
VNFVQRLLGLALRGAASVLSSLVLSLAIAVNAMAAMGVATEYFWVAGLLATTVFIVVFCSFGLHSRRMRRL